VQHSPAGSMVRLRLRQEPEWVEMRVEDQGIGIEPESLSHVFERFYRGDTSRGTPGVGLGLSLVAAVAKLHGGALVLADNHPGLRAQMLIEPNGTRPWRQDTPSGLVAAPAAVNGLELLSVGALAAVKGEPLSR